MRYRYRVLHYTYPDDSETLSKLKGVLRSYTLLLNPDRTSLRDALLMTAMTSDEMIIARSGDTFLIAPLQDVPLGWTSGEEFLVSRERGLEKVAEEIVGREKGTTALKGALIAGLMLLILYTAYHYRALETVNNILLFIGVLLSILGGLLKGYKRRRVRVSAPPHHPE
ncbi:hypothetical protein [Thermococcus sp.]|uniref:hypothetical protein n=1 Tax=Thermococcus sp. TaxID=35749 RepID=UPI00261112C8|nr:hypothetical protein [Thermococcus sp.]